MSFHDILQRLTLICLSVCLCPPAITEGKNIVLFISKVALSRNSVNFVVVQEVKKEVKPKQVLLLCSLKDKSLPLRCTIHLNSPLCLALSTSFRVPQCLGQKLRRAGTIGEHRAHQTVCSDSGRHIMTLQKQKVAVGASEGNKRELKFRVNCGHLSPPATGYSQCAARCRKTDQGKGWLSSSVHRASDCQDGKRSKNQMF